MPFSLPRLLPILLLVLGIGHAVAQPLEDDDYRPRSGDAWIDRQLADMNDYAARYPQSFADEVARYYAVPRAYVEAILQQPGWRPGDIFMGCTHVRPQRDPVGR